MFVFVCFLVTNVIFGTSVLGQNSGNCIIDQISTNEWSSVKTLRIDDSQVEQAIFTSTYTDPLTIGTLTATGDINGNIGNNTKIASYFKFEIDEDSKSLSLYTTKEFGDIDDDAYSNGLATITLNLQSSITCSGGSSTLNLGIVVTDTNTYAPDFLSSSYEFKIPSPLMPQIDFSIYGEGIEATDRDFSNTAVTFDITPKDFEISYVATGDKTFKAVFSTISILQFSGSRSYQLMATDNGNPTKSSHVTLTLTTDEEQSLDSPSFENVFYKYQYSVDANGNGQLKMDGDAVVTANTAKPNDLTDVALHGDYADGYFTVTSTSTTTNQVTFELASKTPLPTDVDDVIALVLSFTTDATVSTSILIYTSTSATLSFDRLYYTGSYYSVNNTVILDDLITIQSTSAVTPTVTLADEDTYSSNFKISPLDGDGYGIAVETPLSNEVLQSEISLVFTVTAVGDGLSSSATLVINLPIKTSTNTSLIYFGNVLYTVEMDPASSSEGTVLARIDVHVDASSGSDVQLSLTDDQGLAEQYFNAAFINNVVTISLKQALTDEVIKSNTIIPLKLTVGIKGTTDTSSAVVNIRIIGGGNGQNSSSDDPTNTGGYIAAISVLAFLLVAILIAALALWYFKLRTRSYFKMEEDSPESRVKFEKNIPRPLSEPKTSTLESRRPTGFVFKANPANTNADKVDDNDSIESSSDPPSTPEEPTKERRKSVAFDPNVEKMQIEPNHEEDEEGKKNGVEL